MGQLTDTLVNGDLTVTGALIAGGAAVDLEAAMGFGASSEKTIASGVVTATGDNHTIDTEADAASDDLVTINGGTDAALLLLKAEHTDRTVVLKDGTGNLDLGADITLDDTEKMVVLIFSSSTGNWTVFASSGLSGEASLSLDQLVITDGAESLTITPTALVFDTVGAIVVPSLFAVSVGVTTKVDLTSTRLKVYNALEVVGNITGAGLIATGNGAINGTILTLGTGAGSSASMFISAAAGNNRLHIIRTGSAARWHWGGNNAAESGSDVGSDWVLNRYNDAASVSTRVLTVSRATGKATFEADLSAAGALSAPSLTLSTVTGLTFSSGSGNNIIKASNAAGALEFQTGGTNTRMIITAGGVTTFTGSTFQFSNASSTIINASEVTGSLSFRQQNSEKLLIQSSLVTIKTSCNVDGQLVFGSDIVSSHASTPTIIEADANLAATALETGSDYNRGRVDIDFGDTLSSGGGAAITGTKVCRISFSPVRSSIPFVYISLTGSGIKGASGQGSIWWTENITTSGFDIHMQPADGVTAFDKGELVGIEYLCIR